MMDEVAQELNGDFTETVIISINDLYWIFYI